MRCIFCNRENPEYAVVCENCGAFLNASNDPWFGGNGILDPILPSRVRCSSCWHDNPATAKNCEVCGMPLLHIPEAEAEISSAQASTTADAAPNPAYEFASEETKQQGSTAAAEAAAVSPSVQGTSAEAHKPNGGFGSGFDSVACEKCGHPNPWYSAFCEECGENLIKEETEVVLPADDAKVSSFEPLVPENETPVARAKQGVVVCHACWYENPVFAVRCNGCGAPLPVGRSRVIQKSAGRQQEEALDRLAELKMEMDVERLKQIADNEEPVVRRVKCAACGSFNLPRAVFCANCGVQLSKPFERGMTQICAKCGATNHKRARFCFKCGLLLKKDSGETTGETGEAEETPATSAAKSGAEADYDREPTLAELIEKHCRKSAPQRRPKEEQPFVRITPKAISKQNRCGYCFHSNPINATLCEKCGTPILRELRDENVKKLSRRFISPQQPAGGSYPSQPGKNVRTVRCRFCSYENEPGATHCFKCGEKMTY